MLDNFTNIVTEDININKPISEVTLLVAMSGGVDSSTIAALLARIGYKVIGVTMNLYSGNVDDVCNTKTCCGSRDIRDAKLVANTFDFRHYVLDYQERFHTDVIAKFAASYIYGETPVPCMDCNRTVKFQHLLDFAKSIGADAMVTGHYVRRKDIDGTATMMTAIDKLKDQSYFLGFTTPKQLEYLRFPLGNFYKSDTRAIAKILGISIHDKPDSQDICFVGGGDYRDFINKFYPNREGDILSIDGRVLGHHNGIQQFTLGQRRGVTIKNYHNKPLYVVKIDHKNNTVTVGERNLLMSKLVVARDLCWLMPIEVGDEVHVKLRSAQDLCTAKVLKLSQDEITLELSEQYFAVTPGQACIVYRGVVVVGGGTIVGSMTSVY